MAVFAIAHTELDRKVDSNADEEDAEAASARMSGFKAIAFGPFLAFGGLLVLLLGGH